MTWKRLLRSEKLKVNAAMISLGPGIEICRDPEDLPGICIKGFILASSRLCR